MASYTDQTMKNQVFFAMNRQKRVAALLDATTFFCWEMCQSALMIGLQLPDGSMANGIGRCRSVAEFQRKAKHSQFTVL